MQKLISFLDIVFLTEKSVQTGPYSNPKPLVLHHSSKLFKSNNDIGRQRLANDEVSTEKTSI